ncbi:MAG TPA: VIT1/CCC1 transporter family protein [Nitrospiria bacterium]|nr:VIT1/CCC1 transporter family protein [Nitrospiria bacterium]
MFSPAMQPGASATGSLPRQLVLDELFDLTLYRSLRAFARPELHATLDELIAVESRHFAFWKNFFSLQLDSLDSGRRLKLRLIKLACRLTGDLGMQLVLEAIEVYGVRKYLALWERYRHDPLGGAVRGILEDEFQHEDEAVTRLTARKINPDRIRNIFLGFNDGLVEILGAVSGFYAAFGSSVMVVLAGVTTAVAGALSMAAGAYIAVNSEQEVRRTQTSKRRFLDERAKGDASGEPALGTAAVVGASYFAGAVLPILPVLMGATTALASILAGGLTILLVSMVLAFLSGMDVRKRMAMNLVIIAAAVGVSYAIGAAVRALWGVDL